MAKLVARQKKVKFSVEDEDEEDSTLKAIPLEKWTAQALKANQEIASEQDPACSNQAANRSSPCIAPTKDAWANWMGGVLSQPPAPQPSLKCPPPALQPSLKVPHHHHKAPPPFKGPPLRPPLHSARPNLMTTSKALPVPLTKGVLVLPPQYLVQFVSRDGSSDVRPSSPWAPGMQPPPPHSSSTSYPASSSQPPQAPQPPPQAPRPKRDQSNRQQGGFLAPYLTARAGAERRGQLVELDAKILYPGHLFGVSSGRACRPLLVPRQLADI